MDDIYGDLENYNDVNLIEELKHENSELKIKLDEYASELTRLRTEFDLVTSEFKKLELNYSSLLKTARAEIERKTQIITTLNNEKDMLILNSIHNSSKGILRRVNNRDRSNSRNSRKDLDCANALPEIKKYEAVGIEKRERGDENSLPSTDTVVSENTEDSTKNQTKSGKVDSYDKGESKENIDESKRAQSLKHRRKSMPILSKRAQSLKHRRKSMPILSKQIPKFSSDEENDNCSAEEDKRDWKLREHKNRKLIDRYKHVQKVSETSGIDEKYSSYHESSRETHYKSNLHRHSDKYRSTKNRHEPRHKRRSSTEKSRRTTRDYLKEPYQRTDHKRHRVLESPPVEKPDHHRWVRDRRSRYDRDESQDEMSRRDSSHHYPHRSRKHRATSDYDEPTLKRARTDSCTQIMEKEPILPKQNPIIQDILAPEFSGHLMNASCQSPDYAHHEVSAQPREIKSTALVKLEDPRLKSQRYVKKVEGERVTMSSVTGIDVDIKAIDTSTWDIVRVEVPEALQRPPKYSSEDLCNADNPVSNMSTESGEIHSESNDAPMREYVRKSFFEDYENERLNQESNKVTRNITEKKNERPYYIDDDDLIVNIEKRLPPVKYKIPKPIHVEEEKPNPLRLLIKHIGLKCGVDTNKINDTKLDVDKTFGESPHKDEAKDKVNEIKPVRQTSGRPKKVDTQTIEDLKLSDESSDNVIVQKCSNKVKEQKLDDVMNKKLKAQEEPKQLQKNDSKIKIEETKDKNSKPYQQSHVKTDIQNKELKNSKKTHKKSSKQKSKNSKNDDEVVPLEKVEKKHKTNKTKESKEQHKGKKSKFSDLFGDSCSLITPEDLGVPEAPTQTESAKTYLPIFEDAQDALDVNVKILKETIESVPETVQPNKSSENRTEIEKIKDHKINDAENKILVNIPIEKITPNMREGKVIEHKTNKVENKIMVNIPTEKITLNMGEEKSKEHKTNKVENKIVLNIPLEKIPPNMRDEKIVELKSKKVENKLVINTPISQITPNIGKEKTMEYKSNEVGNNIVVNIPIGKVTPNMEVSNVLSTKESDVVKTVIISSGVQPQIEEPNTNNNIIEKLALDPQDVKVPEIPIALATSTPYKKLLEMELQSCNSSDASSKNDETSSVDKSSVSNVDTQNGDVPDLRIFVRRRRKFKK